MALHNLVPGDASRTMACNMMDESALEGVQAFIEKRKPDWR